MVLLLVVLVVVMLVIVVIYGNVIWDLIDLMSWMMGIGVGIVFVIFMFDMMCCNFVVNFVGFVYDFLSLWLKVILYCMGGMIIVMIVIVMMLWKIFVMMDGYIFIWFVGYLVLFGLVVGILMVDYFLICGM